MSYGGVQQRKDFRVGTGANKNFEDLLILTVRKGKHKRGQPHPSRATTLGAYVYVNSVVKGESNTDLIADLGQGWQLKLGLIAGFKLFFHILVAKYSQLLLYNVFQGTNHFYLL